MPLPEKLMGDAWSPAIAREILPLLVAHAEACKPITYGQLSREVVRRKWGHYVMPLAYRYPAGAIGYALEETGKEWGEPIPPINALVVNDATGLPGKGVDYFLGTYLRQTNPIKRLTDNQRKSIVEEIHKDIFNYTGWRKLLQYYGLGRLPSLAATRARKKPKPIRYRWSSEPESEAHKRLKKYISEHPNLIGVGPKNGPGLTECLLPSADQIDVLFSEEGWQIAVEVKALNANDDDLYRGIFQCVKYRELLRAEQRTEGVIPQARAVLVTERELPKRLQRVAELLKVPCVRVALISKPS